MDNEKYQNKYRIQSVRLQTWDYRGTGSYFITICTQNREHYFGEIINGKMQLSQMGVIADILWYEMQHRAKNIELGEFVVMPNHIHGILILNEQNNKTETAIDDGRIDNGGNDDGGIDDGGIDDAGIVETGHALSLPTEKPTEMPTEKTIGQQRFQNIGKNSISSIIGSYKSAVTKHANRLGYEFVWQTRFHDHIIRDEKSFQRISDYIINNPAKWEEDKFYQKEQ
jgi:putative transposase